MLYLLEKEDIFFLILYVYVCVYIHVYIYISSPPTPVKSGWKISLHIKWIKWGISPAGMLARVLIMKPLLWLHFVSFTLGFQTHNSSPKEITSGLVKFKNQRAHQRTQSLKCAGYTCISCYAWVLCHFSDVDATGIVFHVLPGRKLADRGRLACSRPTILVVAEWQLEPWSHITDVSNTEEIFAIQQVGTVTCLMHLSASACRLE